MIDLTKGKEGRLILQFAYPMLLGNIFQQLYNVVDSIVVGHYIGKEALAAVGASFPFIFLLISLVIGIASGTTIIIAQYFGARDFKSIIKAIDTLYIFLFFASLFLSAIGIVFSEEILNIIKLPSEVMPEAKEYLTIYLSGLILFFGFNGTSAILRGLGDSKTPLFFLIISTVINVILDLVFVIGFKWGISGVAIATIISQGIAFIIAILYLNKTHAIINLSYRKLVFDNSIFIKSIRIGIPSGLQQTFVALGMLALYRIVNNFSTATIAAYSVAIRINSFASMPAMNFSAALSTFVGQNLGANKPERVKKGFRATLLMTSILSLSVSAVVLIFPESLFGIFTPDQNVIDIGVSYLLIAGPFYIMFSTMFTTQGVLRGAGDTLIPMFITLFTLWIVRIPISYFLSLKIGYTGIWWGIPIAWMMGMVLSYLYYLTGRWKSKVVVKYPIPVNELKE